MEYSEFRAMNSDILLGAEGSPGRVEAGFRAAREFILDSERRLTRFSEESELSQLNRSQGVWFSASPALFSLLGLAREYFYQTGGLFDPSILRDLKRAGYDRSMDEIRSAQGSGLPPADDGLAGTLEGAPQGTRERLDLRERVNFGQALLDGGASSIRLPPGVEIDLGGIAKGWIAGEAARILKDYSSACAVSAGGDLCLLGLPSGQDHWEIALEDPRYPDGTLGILKVGPGAVATSSVTKRSWRRGGRQQHHLIDPRSGEPAVTDWLSVTVAASDAAPEAALRAAHGSPAIASSTGAAAEVYAKALLIAGPDQAMEILAANPELAFIAVDRHGKLWGSPKSREYLDVNT